jgi:hypothetical protein
VLQCAEEAAQQGVLLHCGTTAASGRSIGIITFIVWLYFSELVKD